MKTIGKIQRFLDRTIEVHPSLPINLHLYYAFQNV